jgi:hypothetical protein
LGSSRANARAAAGSGRPTLFAGGEAFEQEVEVGSVNFHSNGPAIRWQ